MRTVLTQACSPSRSAEKVEANVAVRSYAAAGTKGACMRCSSYAPGFRLQFSRASPILNPKPGSLLQLRCACRRVGVIRSGLSEVGEGKKDRPFVYTRAKPEVRWPHKTDELNSQRIAREAENAGRVMSRLLPDWEELSRADAIVREDEGDEDVSREGQTSFARRLETEEMIKKREAFRQRQKGQANRLQSMSKLALRKATDLQNKAQRLSTAVCVLENARPITDVFNDWPEQLNNDSL